MSSLATGVGSLQLEQAVEAFDDLDAKGCVYARDRPHRLCVEPLREVPTLLHADPDVFSELVPEFSHLNAHCRKSILHLGPKLQNLRFHGTDTFRQILQCTSLGTNRSPREHGTRRRA